MEIKNGKAMWAPEDMLGSWIRCTNAQAKKLLTYFKMPTCTYENFDGLYNISKDLKSYQVVPLSDPNVRGYYAFDAIDFPAENKKVKVANCIGKWIKCNSKEFFQLSNYFNIKTFYHYDGYYRISGSHRVEFRFGYDEGNYIKFENIEFPAQPKEILVGYKCPFDIFNGEVKNGTIYSICADGNYSTNKGLLSIKYTLPKELVECWEPVYEPVIKYAKNTALLTKDGRVVGNAIITDYLDGNYLITTDYGNKIRFSEKEVESQWYIGKIKTVGNHKHAVKAK